MRICSGLVNRSEHHFLEIFAVVENPPGFLSTISIRKATIARRMRGISIIFDTSGFIDFLILPVLSISGD